MDKAKAKSAYTKQCWDAKKRGITMLFTFEEWCQWWETHLGPNWQGLRGCHRGQYVMARYQDKGDYQASNVRPLLVQENHVEHNTYKPAPKGKQRDRIAAQHVAAIFKATGKYEDIAARFGVGHHQVHCIKTKKYYRSITDKL